MKLPRKLSNSRKPAPEPGREAVEPPPAFTTRRQWFAGAAGAAIGGTVLAADAALRPSSALAQTPVVDLTSNQTIDGVKTFLKPPVVPAGSFPQAAITGLVDGLASKQDVIPADAYVDTTTAQTVGGLKDFTTPPTVKGSPIGGQTADATPLVKGKLQLAGDLGGTAELPTVPGLAARLGSAGAVIGALATTKLASGRVPDDTFDRWHLDAAGRLYTGGGARNPVKALDLASFAVGVGQFALANNRAIENVAVGAQALRNNTDGTYNVAIGRDAMVSNTTGQQNTGVGFAALCLATGSYNTAVGASALRSATGQGNTAVGVQALQSLTSGAPNTAVGTQALQRLTTGAFNTAIGHHAMAVATTASYCTALGQDALQSATTTTDCTAIGEAAMPSVTTGYGNTAVGHGALRDNVTGAANVAMGVVTLQSITTDANTAIGQNALQHATTGSMHVALGYRAGAMPGGVPENTTTTATRQTLLGALTGQSTTSDCDEIVCVGYSAVAGADGAVALGSGARALHPNSVALGKDVVSTGANQVMVGPNDIEITDQGKGLVLRAPNGTRYRLTVTDDGSIAVTAL